MGAVWPEINTYMEHPLIGDLTEFSDDEIRDKLNELYNKHIQAGQMGNRELLDQIQLVIQSYVSESEIRMKKQIEESAKAIEEGSGYDFDGLINIK